MKGERKYWLMLSAALALSFILGFTVCALFPGINPVNIGGFSQKQINVINQAEKIIKQSAIDGSDTDKNLDYALKGMAASLDDDYAYYFTKEELKEYEDSSNGLVENGIGASIVNDEGRVMIAEVYKGLTADEAGIRMGDELIEIDGVSIENYDFGTLSQRIKGEAGTTVSLTVKRNEKILKFNVTRGSGQRQMTEYRMLQNNILYIRIISFHGNATEYFEKALEYGNSNNYQSIIIDLRENLGGDLAVFERIADILLPEGETFYALNKDNKKINYCVSDSEFIDKPICILQNKNTASASEALSGALKCMGNATVIGTVSYGKGIMQTAYTLSNGGCFKLTVARYYLPNGECIHKSGITPDIEIGLPEELENKPWLVNDENDLQLQKAIEVLTN